MNRLKRVILAGVLTLTVSTYTGCGKSKPEIKIWETEHECGTWEVDSFDELLLDDKVTAEEVAEMIPDFCLYRYKEENFAAKAPVSICGENFESQIFLLFNADKEFIEWTTSGVGYPLADKESFSELMNEFSNWTSAIQSALGGPTKETDTNYNWSVDEKNISVYINETTLLEKYGYMKVDYTP